MMPELETNVSEHSGTTRPPRLKAKPMAGRRGDAEKRRDGDLQQAADSLQQAENNLSSKISCRSKLRLRFKRLF
jgi:hypothetical protein